MVAIQDYGCLGWLVVNGIVEDPLNLDWGELGVDIKGFSVGVDGLLAFGNSWIDGWVPGQFFYFYNFHIMGALLPNSRLFRAQ